MTRRAVLPSLGLALAAACATPPADAPDAGTAVSWRVVLDDLPAPLLSAWEAEDGVLYAVGGSGAGPLVLRHDERGWWRMDPGTHEILWWVFGFSSDEVFAAGEHGTVVAFDGRRWRVVRTGGEFTFYGLWGPSRDDLWAVGGVATTSPGSSAVFHLAEGRWTREEEGLVPVLPIFKVTGDGSSVHVVGEGGEAARWSGGHWVREPTGTQDRLVTVFGRGDELFAVGGLASPLMLGSDGSKWSARPLPKGLPPLLGGALAREGARGLPRAVVVGWEGAVAELEGDVLTKVPGLPREDLHGAAATADGFVAVGGDLLGGRPHGVLFARGALAGGKLQEWPAFPVDPGDGGTDSDAGAGEDAGSPDAGSQEADAGPEEADGGPVAPDAGTEPPDGGVALDAGTLDAGMLHDGDFCELRPSDCALPDLCWILAGWERSVCSHECVDATGCGGFGPGACCVIPGPQTFQQICVPAGVGPCGAADAGP